MVEVLRRARTVSAGDFLRERDGLDPMFLEQLQREDYRHRTAIDVGTGSGRVVWVVAPRAHRVVGVDNDPKRLMEARGYAAVRGFNRVDFVLGDAEKEAWSAFQSEPFDFVFAHLFMSEPVVYRAARHIRAGGKIVLCALHPDHWQETGRESRHSFREEEIADLLEENGFELEFLGVDRTTIECADLLEAERTLGPNVVRRWVEDGRWEGLADSFRRGTRTITHAYVVAKGRRRVVGAVGV